jgi:hypothetical protein
MRGITLKGEEFLAVLALKTSRRYWVFFISLIGVTQTQNLLYPKLKTNFINEVISSVIQRRVVR